MYFVNMYVFTKFAKNVYYTQFEEIVRIDLYAISLSFLGFFDEMQKRFFIHFLICF